MKKKVFLLPLLMVTPLFFMANSPAPTAFPSERYYNFVVTNFVQSDEKNENNRYDFSITIKNNGDNYLFFNGSNFYVYDSNQNYGHINTSSITDYAVNPGKTRTLAGSSPNKLVINDDLQFIASTYSKPYQGKYESITFVEKQKQDDLYFYYYSVNELEVDDEYYHSYIIDYSYLGESRAFDTHYLSGDRFTIVLDEDLGEEDLEINKVMVANGRSKRAGTISSMWIIIWIVIGAVFLMALVAACIVLPIVIPMAVRKKKAKGE